MATNQVLPFSVASVVEDVLQQQGTDWESWKAEEASSRRNDAAGWLRKMVGVVVGKDLPAEPSEEEFRIALRSGIILCNVLNKVQPGAVPKVVEGLCDSVIIPDGAALSTYQYFENVGNFLAAVEEMGLPTFEASDLEQGGKSARLVCCVLALKSYHEQKQGSKIGSGKCSGNSKPTTTAKPFGRRNSEPLMSSLSKALSMSDKSIDSFSSDHSSDIDIGQDIDDAGSSRPLYVLVRELLSDKEKEEIPTIVESMLSRVMEEFERRLQKQNEQMKSSPQDKEASGAENCVSKSVSEDVEMKSSPQHREAFGAHNGLSKSVSEDIKDKGASGTDNYAFTTGSGDGELISSSQGIDESDTDNHVSETCSEYVEREEQEPNQPEKEACDDQKCDGDEVSRSQLLKQLALVEQQLRDIQELKNTLHHTKAGMQLLQMKHEEEIGYLGKHLHGLACAASGYQRVLEENRKLYNQVQDLKGNIRVYCRVRPFLGGQPNHVHVVDHIEEGSITLVNPSKYGKEGKKSFTFNRVFGPSATQGEVFADTQPLIRSVLDGYNVCIFAYGQTGSGKTYTMTGPDDPAEETLGVNYRALRDLFILSEQRKDTISYDISVQMLEIYNEQVRDLLALDGLNKRLEIRNNSQNGINVPDADMVSVTSTSDVINLMNLGHKNRVVSATAMNDRSSRSHSCLTVHVQGKYLTSGTILRGCMHLVDLAGSERVDKSEVTGDGLKEAVHINKSLSALGDVISSLAQKNSHIPYRNSKLTQLLQDALGGQAKTLMFVHISPEPDALVETISTLKFAERVSTVELGAARANKDGTDVKELKEQIANLKAALARKEGETANSSHVLSSSPERYKPKSRGSSPSNPSWKRNGDVSGGRRQQVDDVETKKKSTSKLKRRSLDPQDMMNSNLWPSIGSPALSTSTKEDDKDSVLSADWVDKIMVNKLDSSSGDDNLLGQWEEDSAQSDALHLPDPPKIYPEQTSNEVTLHKKDRDNQLDSADVATTCVSFEPEVATSDSSESDLIWQSIQPKPTNIPNAFGTKGKKSYLKAAKSAEARSLIPSLIPSPARKPTNGVNQTSQRPARQAVNEGRRRSGNAK